MFQKILTQGDTKVGNIVGNIEYSFEDVENGEHFSEGTH